MSDDARKKHLNLCRDCERQLTPENPYSRRCTACAVKVRPYIRRRMVAQPWSRAKKGREPIAEKNA